MAKGATRRTAKSPQAGPRAKAVGRKRVSDAPGARSSSVLAPASSDAAGKVPAVELEAGDRRAASVTRRNPRAAKVSRASSSATSPGTPSRPASSDHWIVGLGASAGGLEAITLVLRTLPVELPVAWVVVQHMSHTHRSMLVQLLARETTLPVLEVEDGMVPEPGRVYIAPARKDLRLTGAAFRLTDPHVPGRPVPSVDEFFLSLADAMGSKAVGVVLSGTGADGAQGVRALKLGGGNALAQLPENAKYDGMPRAAIATGAVDQILPATEMGKAMRQLIHGTPSPDTPAAPPPESSPTISPMAELLRRVQKHTGIDLSGYKENTIERRLARRMQAVRARTLGEYLQATENDSTELDKLLQETLISVTAFFRDVAAYEVLAGVIRQSVQRKLASDEIRIWVAGCATGEEAYSVAMLFQEALSEVRHAPRLRIFATDIDARALQVARRGVYSARVLEALPRPSLSSFFVRRGDEVEISRSLRDCITFARHDITNDPPFLRADLICCRNLLIYFQPSLQARVFPLLRYALAQDGLLFLGKSESASQFEDLFEPLSKSARLYLGRGPRLAPPAVPSLHGRLEAGAAPVRQPGVTEQHIQAVIDELAPPSVLVNREGHVLHSMGDVSHFLQFPVGQPKYSISSVVRKDLALLLQTLMHRAARERAPQTGHSFDLPDGRRYRPTVVPVRHAAGELLLVAFVPTASLPHAPQTAPMQEDTSATVLRDELDATRENLQTVIEELETSNQEMQSLNEEMQSSNEELQSSNEELETSNEELQSTNEELSTVNDELQRTLQQIAEVNADLVSVMQSLSHPVLLVDPAGCVRRHNLASERLFHIPPSSVPPELSMLQLPAAIADLPQLLFTVMRTGQAFQRDFEAEDQKWRLVVQTCLTPSRDVRGCLVHVIDVTEYVNSQQQLSAALQRLEVVMDHSVVHSVIASHAGRIEFASRGFAEWLGMAKDALVGTVLWSHFRGEDAKLVRQRHMSAMSGDKVVETDELIPGHDGMRRFLSMRVPLVDEVGAVTSVCWEMFDITEREHMVTTLAEARALSDAVFRAMPSMIALIGRNGVIRSVNDNWIRFSEENGGSPSAAWIGANYLDHCADNDPARNGIIDVLAGRQERFALDYPCHSPTEDRWFRMLVSPIQAEGGGAAIMHVSITESMLAQRELQALNSQLEAHVELRTRDLRQAVDELEMFSHTVSHDLRSPLRTLIGFTDILQGEHVGGLNEEGRGMLDKVSDAARRMSHYLEELLKLSHLTRGDLMIQDIDLSAMVGQVVDELVARVPGQSVVTRIEPGLTCRADPNLLRAVLENLIGNAIKYSHERKPARVEIGRADHDGRAMFFVRDNGIGFDMSYRDKLFLPFQRLHLDPNISGSGLGLAIVRRIIVRHGGSITAEARPGFGATFFFWLP